VFRLILHEMLATTTGALAGLFVDYEGETVDLVCDRDLDDHSLRVLGAYQVVFMEKLRALCANASAGSPQRFKIEFAEKTVLSFDVKDGYYLVLLVDGTANEALAWRKLERCRERLIEEM